MNAHISEDTDPGKTYRIEVFTIFAEEISEPAVCLVTTKPLRVKSLKAALVREKVVKISWKPNEDSIEDSFVIKIWEMAKYSNENIFRTKENYLFYDFPNDLVLLIDVKAISNDTYSDPNQYIFGKTMRPNHNSNQWYIYLAIILIVIAILILLSIIWRTYKRRPRL